MEKKICCVPGCGKRYEARGYCPKHYMQIKEFGRVINGSDDPNEVEFIGYTARVSLYDSHLNVIAKTVVDAVDYPNIRQYRWHMDAAGYVVTNQHKEKNIVFLHRLLLGVELLLAHDGIVVDHINGDTLYNVRSNIRLCTNSQNQANAHVPHGSNLRRGVSFDASRNKWRAYIGVNHKQLYLGYFVNFEDAVNVRRVAELKYFKEFAPKASL